MNRNGGMGSLIGLVFIGLVIAVGPWAVSFIQNVGKLVLTGAGLAIMTFGIVSYIITNLYRRPQKNRAYVVTGTKGGPKILTNEGMVILPWLHTVTEVNLEQFKIEILRDQLQHALLTSDPLKIKARAVFYFQVNASSPQHIERAATTLGDKTLKPEEVKALVQDQLDGALRAVTAKHTLQELNSDREKFESAVKTALQAPLESFGLVLNDVKILSLDPVPLNELKASDDIFDAQSARQIAQIVFAQNVETNTIKRDSEKQIKEKDVATTQYVKAQEVLQAEAEADADKQKKVIKANKDREAQVVEAEQRQQSGVASVEADKAVELAGVAKSKAVQVAQIETDAATQVAGVARERQVAVAQREQEIAVAEADTRRANAETDQLKAQALRAAADQEVTTTNQVAEAERNKKKAIVQKEGEAAQKKIEQEVVADVAKYTKVKEAEGEQEAAEKKADATIKTATAAKQAKVLEAEGQTAVQMVPVEVNRRQVEVNSAQNAVQIELLKAQQENQAAAIELQTRLAQIAADKEVRIAQATAMGQGLSEADIRIYGDAATLGSVQRMFGTGQAVGILASTVKETVPVEMQNAATAAAAAMSSTIVALVKKFTGQENVNADDAIKALRSMKPEQLGLILGQLKPEEVADLMAKIMSVAGEQKKD